MKPSRTALIGAVASAALIGTAAVAFAQTPSAEQGRVIQVPPGAVVLVLPAGSVPATAMPMGPFSAAMPFPDMPSPGMMIRQIDQMFATMQHSFDVQAAALRSLVQSDGHLGGPVAGVVVTSFSDGHGTCTQRVVYRGDGAAPVVQVSSTGGADACHAAGLPTVTAAPQVQTPEHAAPHLINVRYQSHPAAPLTYAMAGQ